MFKKLFEKNKWKTFNNLAKAIELTKARGHIVTWNSDIEGLGFDAIVRIQKDIFSYSIVVDCIESENLVTRNKVEEFIKKAVEAQASIVILASKSGFEDNCLELGRDSFLRLVTLENINKVPADIITRAFDLVLNQTDFGFLLKNNGLLVIPDEPGILKMFLQETKIEGHNINTTPEGIINEVRKNVYKQASGVEQEFKYEFPEGTVLIHPNTLERIPTLGFRFSYKLLTGLDLDRSTYDKGPYLIDNIIEDELLKRNATADISCVGSGKTFLKVNGYYYNPHLQFSYYCETVKNSEAIMALVESLQLGRQVQGRFKVTKDQFSQFIEITNDEEIKRLAKLYERYTIRDKNLRGRFEAFLKNLENAECIDELEHTNEQKIADKADYFFENRKIIGELKTLETDTSDKVNKILDKYKARPEYPLIFGSVPLQSVLKNFPDKEKINEEIALAITATIERIIEKANRQIRETKETFSLPEAEGILIILNDLIYSLTPDVIAYRINKSLKKRTHEGGLRFPNISMVLVIHSAHYTEINTKLDGLPILAINNEFSNSEMVKDFTNSLIPKWSKFEGIPLIDIEKNIRELKFKKTNDKRAKKKNQ